MIITNVFIDAKLVNVKLKLQLIIIPFNINVFSNDEGAKKSTSKVYYKSV